MDKSGSIRNYCDKNASHQHRIGNSGADSSKPNIYIYNNIDLVNKYGNMPTPRICLIDKSGKLVYDNIGLGKNGDFELNELREKLKEEIH